MSGKVITKRAFYKKLNKWNRTFRFETQAAESIGMSRQQFAEILNGNKPPTEAVQKVIGYRLNRETTVIDTYIEIDNAT